MEKENYATMLYKKDKRNLGLPLRVPVEAQKNFCKPTDNFKQE